MKVTMIGTGYVGLVSGVCFAEIGHDVTCVDIRPEIIDMLKNGESPIFEPGLSDMITRNYKGERISFSTSYDSVKDAEFVFLGVGTPQSDTGKADLSYLQAAAKSTAEALQKDGTVVVIKSTVPVNTHKMIESLMKEHTAHKFHIVNNPEFLKEGAAIDDFMKPDRVVVGYRDEDAKEKMEELYQPLVLQGHPIHCVSNLSAEMIKYASNCMLATKISFMNEIAKICDLSGADVEEVRLGMASDRRIGPHFIYPGPGYGGSCFPKDVNALMFTARELGMEMEVITAVDRVNDRQKTYMFEKMMKHFGNDVKGKSFAFWGAAFKPNTDDIRESPSIYMAEALVEAGATINFYDPEAADNFEEMMTTNPKTEGKVKRFNNKYDALNGTSGLVLMTEWLEFRAPDFTEFSSRLVEKVVFDARNIYSAKKMREFGLDYYAIGKAL
ncbi:MAG: UDP-glucose/GDP-mannose dehydrogenase family protein [Bacteriovoracaceae bacterium]|nr:UDP-glucose/GDP-mannose dehydrogenase family protein [Bacteriovoracaceae bacterium]